MLGKRMCLIVSVALIGMWMRPAFADTPLKVVATFSILADWVEQIGGDQVEVYSLVGLDEDAHIFHPSPKDIQAVARADLLVWNGLGFEGWLDRVVASSGFKGQRLIASAGIDVIHLEKPHWSAAHHRMKQHNGEHDEHAHENVDPHAWHSLLAAKRYVTNISNRLQELRPQHKALFQKREAAYLNKLEQLRQDMLTRLSAISREQKRIVVPHNAFAYLGRDLDIEIFSLQGVTTSAEASAKAVAEVISVIRNHDIRAIFSENISDNRLIHRVQDETGVKLGGGLISGALSADKAPTYLDMMRHNLDMITSTLTR